MDERYGVYQIGTKSGIIKGCLSRNELEVVKDIHLDKNEILNKIISVREAVSQQSPFNGRGFSKCHCKSKRAKEQKPMQEQETHLLQKCQYVHQQMPRKFNLLKQIAAFNFRILNFNFSLLHM